MELEDFFIGKKLILVSSFFLILFLGYILFVEDDWQKQTAFLLSEMRIPGVSLISSSLKESSFLELVIPSIKLKQVVYSIDSWRNDVDFHVEVLKDSKFDQNVYFLAAHSGDGNASYFNELSLLEIGDLIYLKTRKEKLVYVIDQSYFIYKNGYLLVEEDLVDVIFLITCSLEYPDKQLIIKGYLL